MNVLTLFNTEIKISGAKVLPAESIVFTSRANHTNEGEEKRRLTLFFGPVF